MPSLSNSLKRCRPLLGTLVEIKAAGHPSRLLPAMDAAFAAIERVQVKMSFHEGDSDVSRINGACPGSQVLIDPHTYRVLEFALWLGALSGGAFDIAVAPALVRNRFLPRPGGGESPQGPAACEDLELLGGDRVRVRRKVWIDLGGIAKGYAVDMAVGELMAFGLSDGIVNAGGDLRCFGEPQPIQVRHPETPSVRIPLGSISDHAIATSSGFYTEATYGGRDTDPLVDPGLGECTTWDASISVIAPDCMAADALTKVVRLAPESAPGILAGFQAQAVVIDKSAVRSCGGNLLREAVSA